MKREIPVFQYNDAWQMLASVDRLNGLVIDASSEEVMLRIEKTMSKILTETKESVKLLLNCITNL